MLEVLSMKMLQAAEFAAMAHLGQKRKVPEDVPYISHCFAVGFILLKLGYPDDVIIAGVLHDVVEDTKFTSNDISVKFGEKVASYVRGVSEQDKSKPWKERKEAYRRHLESQPPEVKTISAADLLANRLSLLECLRLGQSDVLSRFKVSLDTMLENDKLRIDIVKEAIPVNLLKQIQDAEAELSTHLSNNSNTT